MQKPKQLPALKQRTYVRFGAVSCFVFCFLYAWHTQMSPKTSSPPPLMPKCRLNRGENAEKSDNLHIIGPFLHNLAPCFVFQGQKIKPKRRFSKFCINFSAPLKSKCRLNREENDKKSDNRQKRVHKSCKYAEIMNTYAKQQTWHNVKVPKSRILHDFSPPKAQIMGCASN